MDHRLELAVFDLDGTILDTLEDLAGAVNHALAANGFPGRSLAEVRAFLGNGVRNLILRSLPGDADGDCADAVLADFRAYYALHSADRTKPYDGIPDLLRELRAAGIRTAVVSNKTDDAVQKLIAHYFDGLFDHIAGEKENVARKPAPDSVLNALSALGMRRENAVYIGDSEVDILTAQNAGLPCVTVTWGFRDEDFLRSRGAELCVHDTEELKRCLQRAE